MYIENQARPQPDHQKRKFFQFETLTDFKIQYRGGSSLQMAILYAEEDLLKKSTPYFYIGANEEDWLLRGVSCTGGLLPLKLWPNPDMSVEHTAF